MFTWFRKELHFGEQKDLVGIITPLSYKLQFEAS